MIQLPASCSQIDWRGLPAIRVANTHAIAVLTLYGAQVVEHVPRGAQPLIWMSPHVVIKANTALRGGVPLCWPWFGAHADHPEWPAHGVARIRTWELVEAYDLPDGQTRVVCRLATTVQDVQIGYALEALLTVTIGAAIDIALTTVNHDRRAVTYEDCLHTYIAVGDAARCTVTGLQGICYADKLRGYARFIQGEILATDRATDQHHHVHAGACEIRDPVFARTVRMRKRGSWTTVVWTPHAGGTSVADIGDAWRGFLCVEAANAGEERITLLPGTSHTTATTIEVV